MQYAKFPRSLDDAEAFDASDPLASARLEFDLPEGVTYLVGHSLGPPPRSALSALRGAGQEDWARGLVGSWNTAGWIDMPATVGGRIAHLIGVPADDVIVCDSVSMNLFKLVGGAYWHQRAAEPHYC
jgi:kynureninase